MYCWHGADKNRSSCFSRHVPSCCKEDSPLTDYAESGICKIQHCCQSPRFMLNTVTVTIPFQLCIVFHTFPSYFAFFFFKTDCKEDFRWIYGCCQGLSSYRICAGTPPPKSLLVSPPPPPTSEHHPFLGSTPYPPPHLLENTELSIILWCQVVCMEFANPLQPAARDPSQNQLFPPATMDTSNISQKNKNKYILKCSRAKLNTCRSRTRANSNRLTHVRYFL